MATLPEVLDTYRKIIIPAVGNLIVEGKPIEVDVQIGPPAVNTLQDVGKNKFALVSIVSGENGPIGRQPISKRRKIVKHTCGIFSELSNDTIAAGESETLTLSYAPTTGNAVRLYDGVGLRAFFGTDSGATAIAESGETLSTLAAKLADSINNRPTIKDWFSATADDEVVTITNQLDAPIKIETSVGNRATIYRVMTESFAHMQLVAYAKTQKMVFALGSLLETRFARFEINHHYSIPETLENLDIFFDGALPNYDNTQKDFYSYHVQSSVKFTMIEEQPAYPFLVGITSINYSKNS